MNVVLGSVAITMGSIFLISTAVFWCVRSPSTSVRWYRVTDVKGDKKEALLEARTATRGGGTSSVLDKLEKARMLVGSEDSSKSFEERSFRIGPL